MDIGDPTAIRALAHPLRLDLMELLASTGPATAAQCGRALGASQASCSFHLRQLAKYGFVEEAGPGPDRRERRWQVPEERPVVRVPHGSGTALEGLVVERATRAVLDHARRHEEEPAEWQDAAGVISLLAALTADEAAQLKDQLRALLMPYAARTGPLEPGQRHVRIFLAATPLRQDSQNDSQNDSQGEQE